nr:hypothetical protein [uncultured Janthinobacterium sp.]
MARVDASLIARPYKQAGRQRSMPSSSSRMLKVLSKVSIIPFLYRRNIKTDVAKGCFWPFFAQEHNKLPIGKTRTLSHAGAKVRYGGGLLFVKRPLLADSCLSRQESS